MKIAIVSPVFPPYKGGIGTVAHIEACELSRRGHKVSVFTPNYNNNKTSEARFNLFLLKPIIKHGNAGFLPQLFWRLKDFDVVHLHYPFFGGAEVIWLWRLLFNSKARLVVTYHHDVVGNSLLGKFFSWHSKYLMPFILRSSDKIIVSSFDYIKNSNARVFFNSNTDKFRELPFGLDIERFSPKEKDTELLRRHNLKDKDKIILFLGGLDKAHYFKGLKHLIRTKKNIKGSKLLIVGDGDMRSSYEEMADHLEIIGEVIFTGSVSDKDLPDYYNLADVFVLPSIDKSEAFGIVLTEAMACGKPVVTSDLPGVRNVVDDEVNGFLVEPKDETELASKINLILSNIELQNRMGKEGRRKIEATYSMKKVFNQMEEILEIGEKRKICLISNLYPPFVRGGAEKIAKDIAGGLKAKGHDIFSISTKPYKGLSSLGVEKNEDEKVKIYRFFPLNIFYCLNDYKHNFFLRMKWHFLDMFNLHSFFAIKKILKKEKPSIVMTHNLKGIGYLIPYLIRKRGIRHIHTLHDVQLSAPSGLIIHKKENNLEQRIFLRKWYEAICRWLFDSPDVVISPSRWLLDFYTKNDFFKNSKKVVLPNPISWQKKEEADNLEHITLHKTEKRKRDEPQLLYIGQIEEHKGVVFLINTLKKLDINFKLHVVGDGSGLKEAKKVVGDDRRFVFYGFLNKKRVEQVFCSVDFTVVPSLCYENSPAVIGESLSLGVPVIVSRIGGAAELVQDGKNGFVFEAGNQEELSKVLDSCCEISQNKSEIEKIKKDAAASVKNLKLNNYLEKIKEIL